MRQRCHAASPGKAAPGRPAQGRSLPQGGKSLQRRLSIGSSNDPLEREADRVAQGIHVRGGAPLRIGRAAVTHDDDAAAAAPESVAQVLAGSGRALESSVRQDMALRFGHDFSRVRVHADAAAQRSAAELNAHAYTVGNDIVFGPGRYTPASPGGARLLAHELTHVLQQSEGVIRRSERDPDEAAAALKEDQALTERAKRALASGRPDFIAHEVIWRLIKNYRLDQHFELNGSRYDKKQQGVKVDMDSGKDAPKGAAITGTVVVGDDMLTRVANGEAAKVAHELEAQIGTVDIARATIDYLFIMGKDAPKSNNRFYTYAKAYFEAEYPNAVMVEDARDLAAIIEHINTGGKPVATVHIVSHAHPDGTLQFSLDPNDPTPHQVQFSELKKANAEATLTKPRPDLLGFWTRVMIHGCNLGRNDAMLKELNTAFGGKGEVSAPTHEQVYGTDGESLGGPFYEEPGISKLSDEQAFQRIKAKPEYAFITDWDAMRSKLTAFRRSAPEIVYSGPFPPKGKELAYLLAQPGYQFAKNFTFSGSRIEGGQTLFTYRSPDRTKWGDITIDAETPPDDAAAIVLARASVARPDAFAYRVQRQQVGMKLTVTVLIERTEWELYHARINKQGRGFNPSAGTRPWYGSTEP